MMTMAMTMMMMIIVWTLKSHLGKPGFSDMDEFSENVQGGEGHFRSKMRI